ncbi:farnesyl diphosphate synthase [Sphingobium sp. B2D3A]|uniref:polyprenyl synthetase family protein n=1 Tax=unclassified Sphingobium TaxID=2611147 RepID=UPI0022254A24|nr:MULTISPECIES: farnesyl diphosphate synthase [unclassified Sphingobium]MCW2336922.1 farnesyl diphosphate synthase [Sphingobium sp. B2D3A]MCW2386676.1 farnesyl diphosphate synthase [Sphingobium sp. B2D3D]
MREDAGTRLETALTEIAEAIDVQFDRLLPVPEDQRARLYEAMRYSAIGGGKRLRPLLVKASCDLFNIGWESAVRAGLAVECIHVYSLIHDDLPAMDNDDMRRGKPTAHRAFDEATAILAGDCLHDLAFAVLADERTHADATVRCELIASLALASGPAGMAGGQMMDLVAETTPFDLPAITRLQLLKTGALIVFCLEAGAIFARIPEERRTSLRGYAHDVGLAFQIADDLLDIEGDAAVTGKAVGKDAAAGKATFASLMGVEKARQQASLLVAQAKDHLRDFGAEADLLRDIADFAISRSY